MRANRQLCFVYARNYHKTALGPQGRASLTSGDDTENSAEKMTCVCVRCGAVQSHLYMRYPHGSVLSTPCETCSSPDGSNTAREENANATRGRGDVVINQKQAADPYVENDGLVVFLDLILVKPRAFRHLLFNRPVLDYERQSNDAAGERNAKRVKKKADGIEFLPSVAVPDSAAWLRAVRSFVAVQLVDSFLRWYYLCE